MSVFVYRPTKSCHHSAPSHVKRGDYPSARPAFLSASPSSLFLLACFSAPLPTCLSSCLSSCCLHASLLACLSAYLPAYLYVCTSACLSVCLPECLSQFLVSCCESISCNSESSTYVLYRPTSLSSGKAFQCSSHLFS